MSETEKKKTIPELKRNIVYWREKLDESDKEMERLEKKGEDTTRILLDRYSYWNLLEKDRKELEERQKKKQSAHGTPFEQRVARYEKFEKKYPQDNYGLDYGATPFGEKLDEIIDDTFKNEEDVQDVWSSVESDIFDYMDILLPSINYRSDIYYRIKYDEKREVSPASIPLPPGIKSAKVEFSSLITEKLPGIFEKKGKKLKKTDIAELKRLAMRLVRVM